MLRRYCYECASEVAGTPEVCPHCGTVLRFGERSRRFGLAYLLNRLDELVASWMNQVETWFSILQRQALGRESFESVRAVVARIERAIREWDERASPFLWVKTADEILAKAVRTPKAPPTAGSSTGRSRSRCIGSLVARP